MAKHRIFIEGLRLYAYHGVMPQEQVIGAYFTVDMIAETDFRCAIDTDELDGTISYADLYEVVKREMAIPSKLLEHVAGRIAKAVLHDFPNIYKVKLRIMKQNPPMGADLLGCGVEIEEERRIR